VGTAQVAEQLEIAERKMNGMSVGAWIHVMGNHANSLLARELAARPRTSNEGLQKSETIYEDMRPHTTHQSKRSSHLFSR
jgi:hypothetical protein